ncbi:sodium- and chloride-dependent transporter XTRP3-like isoform X3 [Thunnus maccoyii]|uniref:sodium- and chloride-dependent transporter XTRP3-like isoform X3 n=1 Tax=Thunnus maccoyii TaxID=8240 RepID=UPI001C4B8E53|nr:sodium- and chloride-dependent transporter XTRP3-like isoform X3 [Thunnus maccoyii]
MALSGTLVLSHVSVKIIRLQPIIIMIDAGVVLAVTCEWGHFRSTVAFKELFQTQLKRPLTGTVGVKAPVHQKDIIHHPLLMWHCCWSCACVGPLPLCPVSPLLSQAALRMLLRCLCRHYRHTPAAAISCPSPSLLQRSGVFHSHISLCGPLYLPDPGCHSSWCHQWCQIHVHTQAFASYNQYNNNFERQAIVVSLINSGTSIFASIVTFAIYGFKATVNYEDCLERTRLLLLNAFSLAEDSITLDNVFEWIEKLNTTYPQQFAELANKLENCDLESELDTAVEGTGLAFIVYSEAIKNMPLSQLWSVLYFFMLLLLGMGSMLGNITAIITPLRDFKVISRMSNEMFNGLVCLFCLLLGLGFTTTSGNYWFTMFNDYGATFSLLFIVLIEVITVSYIYGIKRFEKDIEDMLGHRPHWYWKIMWTGVSPLLLIALFIFYIINYIQGGTPTYQAWNKELGKSVVTEYPVFGQVFIGLLLVSSVSCVPLTALSVYCRKRKHGHHKRQRTVSTVSA